MIYLAKIENTETNKAKSLLKEDWWGKKPLGKGILTPNNFKNEPRQVKVLVIRRKY